MAPKSKVLEFDLKDKDQALAMAKQLQSDLSAQLGGEVELDIAPELMADPAKFAEYAAGLKAQLTGGLVPAKKGKPSKSVNGKLGNAAPAPQPVIKKQKQTKPVSDEDLTGFLSHISGVAEPDEVSTEVSTTPVSSDVDQLHVTDDSEPPQPSIADPATIYVPQKLTVEQLESEDLYTPITPDLWDKAELTGVQGFPLMIGGSDIEDALAVVYVYFHPTTKKRQIVIYCRVKLKAEEKISAAIGVSKGMQTVTKTVEEEVHERAVWDTQQSLGEKLETWARSINHRVNQANNGKPEKHKDEYIQGLPSLETYLTTLIATTGQSMVAAELELAKLYLHDVLDLRGTMAWNDKNPDNLRKTFNHSLQPTDKDFIRKNFGPRTAPFKKTKVIEIQVPVTDEMGPTLDATERPATRIDVSTKNDGKPYWNGHSRGQTNGTEILVDFGDGWSACYRPHTDKYGIIESYRGNLEFVIKDAPADVEPAGIVEHLRRLYLNGAPLTKVQAELAFLEENVISQGLLQTAANAKYAQLYKQVQNNAANKAETAMHYLASTGEYMPDDSGIMSIMMEGERIIAPQKVSELRLIFEQKMGLKPGDLSQQPSYDATPIWDGQFFFRRFDIKRDEIDQMFYGKSIGHTLTGNGGNILDQIILTSGALVAQEKRLQMGVNAKAGSTSSQSADQGTGGANFIFCRISTGDTGHFDLEWSNDALFNLLSRTDWFWRNDDQYGNTQKDADGKYIKEAITDVKKVSKATAGNNEIVFKYGIGLTGPFAPTKIRASKHGLRDQVLAAYKQLGITHLHGMPIEKVVV